MNINRQFLFAIAPGASNDIVDGIVESQKYLALNGLGDPVIIAHFFAQCAAETQGFTRLEENLTYTSVKRLRQVWPSRFPSNVSAAPYVRNPKKLANFVYGGRLGNLPGTDDGYEYRGSGMKQTTGRYNYTIVQNESGLKCVARPELLRSFPAALESAAIYWRTNKLALFAMRGDVEGLTRAIQGGLGGLADRRTYTQRALKAIRATPVGGTTQVDERPSWVRKGNRNKEAVATLQEALKAVGYYDDGVIDGVFGEATDRAVRDFQGDHMLIVDGVVGPATLEALEKVTHEPVAPLPGVPAPDTAPGGLGALLAAVLRALLQFITLGKAGK